MKSDNERRDAQILSGAVSQSQIHLTSDDFVTAVIGFFAVAGTTEIVCQHAVPINI